MMKKKKSSAKIIITLCLVGLSGSVLFFPLQLKDDHTCLFQKAHYGLQRSCDYVDPQMVSHNEMTMNDNMLNMHDMERKYLFPYGILWWGSIAVLILSVGILKNRFKKNDNRVDEESDDTKVMEQVSIKFEKRIS